MNSAITRTSKKSGRVRCGLVEQTLLKAARTYGYKVTRISAEAMARAKGRSRRRDDKLIRTGKATPTEIQIKDDMVPGKIEVLDWSPIFA